MSEETTPTEAAQPQQPQPRQHRIEIIYDESNGAVTVSAPMGAKIICYGMLKAAEKEVDKFQVQQPPKLAQPNGMPRGVWPFKRK